MKIKKQSGQILVLTLLVVVVVLAVGLSVASRNLTNLKTSTQAEQSQRAFSAAEGGVEDVLSKLNGVANVIQSGISGSTNCVKEDDETANCTLPGGNPVDPTIVGTVKVKASKNIERTIEPGDVAQLNLAGFASGSVINIDWRKSSDAAFSTLEFIFVCNTGTGGGSKLCMGDDFSPHAFGQFRAAFRYGSPTSGSDSTPACSTIGVTPGFSCRTSFTVASGTTPSNVQILRIKPFWNRTTIRVSSNNDATFPVQSYEITSTATTDTGVSRKVEVRRDALPQLPAIFDYALYSGGNIVK